MKWRALPTLGLCVAVMTRRLRSLSYRWCCGLHVGVTGTEKLLLHSFVHIHLFDLRDPTAIR